MLRANTVSVISSRVVLAASLAPKIIPWRWYWRSSGSVKACSVRRVSPSPTCDVSDAKSASPMGTLATTAGASVGSSRSTTRTVAFGTIIAPQTAANSRIHFALSFHEPPKAVRNRTQASPATPASCPSVMKAPPEVIAATAFRRSTR